MALGWVVGTKASDDQKTMLDAVLAKRTTDGDVERPISLSWAFDRRTRGAGGMAKGAGDYDFADWGAGRAAEIRLWRWWQRWIAATTAQPSKPPHRWRNTTLTWCSRAPRPLGGGAPRPSAKFKGLVDEFDANGNQTVYGKLPFLRWGDTTLVTAFSGIGKTTFGTVWAEHNTWYMGYYCLYIYLETRPETIGDRMLARLTGISAHTLNSGIIDIADPNDKLAQKLRGVRSRSGIPLRTSRCSIRYNHRSLFTHRDSTVMKS